LSLVANSVSLVYSDHGKEVFACKDISIQVEKGEFVGILGPSGSGKSSLLYLMSGLKIPTSGQVLFENQDLQSLNDNQRALLRLRSFGFVFQQPYLLGYLTALENVLTVSPEHKFAIELLDSLGIGSKANRLPHELSGGERQRVCIARALVNKPKVIFADEPTAALDHSNGIAVVDLLNKHRGEGSLVMVTHDVSMIQQADRQLTISESKLLI
jgi:putative ABC transport system ATP-binding protein